MPLARSERQAIEQTPRDRLVILRDHLAGLKPELFDMDEWEKVEGDCGTAACIGGWTSRLFGASHKGSADRLGLTAKQASRLFYPYDGYLKDYASAFDATPAQAAAVIDHLLNTGEVDWSVA